MKKIKIWRVIGTICADGWEWRVIWETRETMEILAQGCVIDTGQDTETGFAQAMRAALPDYLSA